MRAIGKKGLFDFKTQKPFYFCLFSVRGSKEIISLPGNDNNHPHQGAKLSAPFFLLETKAISPTIHFNKLIQIGYNWSKLL